MEDIDFRQRRDLDKSLVMYLAACHWIKKNQNLIITGPTGVGKTYLACAMVHKACLEGYSALYYRLPNLLRDIYPHYAAKLAKNGFLCKLNGFPRGKAFIGHGISFDARA